ncbi:GNAT family N-acetyltransferase [Shouchella sp. 1P09AA]|uniref:GNAT family N-acetyltransferase n=1 Tax=unclassified Shouchella TaxID=2893065 RepID=UPI00399F5A20
MIHIRDMNKSDINKIRALATKTWKATYTPQIPDDIQKKVIRDAYSTQEMNRRFRLSINLVAEEDGVIVGYAFLSREKGAEHNAYLESLYVDPDCQGKGIGKSLLYRGLERFNHPDYCRLIVYKGNSSIHFYYKEGFQQLKERKGDFFGHPVVLIEMKKQIAPKITGQ